MREIKFRGRTLEGALVYGNYWEDEEIATIDNELVDKESVAQLVGHDREGNELYDGDIVKDYSGDKYQVSWKMDWELYFGDKSKEFILI